MRAGYELNNAAFLQGRGKRDIQLRRMIRRSRSGPELIENGIRPIAIGKKNWLFGGETTGHRAAILRTMVETPPGTRSRPSPAA